MYLSNYEFRLLKYIHRHPYIAWEKLSSHRTYKKNPVRFKRTISKFQLNNMLEAAPFRSPEEDTGQRYSQNTVLTDHMHLVLSELGRAIAEERIMKFWGFLLPYGITTLIAIASLFL